MRVGKKDKKNSGLFVFQRERICKKTPDIIKIKNPHPAYLGPSAPNVFTRNPSAYFNRTKQAKPKTIHVVANIYSVEYRIFSSGCSLRISSSF